MIIVSGIKIYGIKLPNPGENRHFFSCDLEIWRMTLKK